MHCTGVSKTFHVNMYHHQIHLAPNGGGGARTFSMAHMMKSTLGGGWCKTQISKSTQGSFLCLGGGVGVKQRFRKVPGYFFYEK